MNRLSFKYNLAICEILTVSALFIPFWNLCNVWFKLLIIFIIIIIIITIIIIIIIIINHYSQKWRWIAVDIYLAAKRRG